MVRLAAGIFLMTFAGDFQDLKVPFIKNQRINRVDGQQSDLTRLTIN